LNSWEHQINLGNLGRRKEEAMASRSHLSLNLVHVLMALTFIPADDRPTWVKVAMALKSALGDEGLDIWLNWSRNSESFNERDAIATWKSIRPEGRTTIATLFHEAKRYGWTPPQSAPVISRHTPKTTADRNIRDDKAAEKERLQAAANAVAIWDMATAAGRDHPYLLRKGVEPLDAFREIDATVCASTLGYPPNSGGTLLSGRLLVVPITQGNGLSSVEFIDEEGRKSALAGRGSRAGGYWATDRLPQGNGEGLTLLVGEGVATVLSARAATGHIGVAAFSEGNLCAVTSRMRQRFPAAELILLADVK
jgi:putative DNA primase/helicase